MTVSFDGLISTYKIPYHERLFQVRYDASTGLYTSDVTNPTTFDLFRDDATVGDWIGWGWSRGVWHDLALTIGTAMAGVGITLEWEYSSYNPSTGALTWTALTVTDGTSGLTTSGTVAFGVPDDWRWIAGAELVAGLSANVVGPMIRCRITAATSVSEGGACTAKADAKDYAVKVVGSETPASMYAADIAAGWGRVTRAGSHLFACDANLRIGDGATATTFTIAAGAVLQVGTEDSSSIYTRYHKKKRIVIAENPIDTWAMGVISGSDYSDGGVLLHCPYASPYNQNPANFWRCRTQWVCSQVYWLGGALNYHVACWQGQASANDILIRLCCLSTNSVVYFSTPIPASQLIDTVWVGLAASNFYAYDSDLAIQNLMFGRGNGILIGNTATVADVNFGTAKKLSVSNAGTVGTAKNCAFAGALATQIVPSTGTTANVQYDIEIIATDSSGAALSDCHVRIVDAAGTVVYSGTYSTAVTVTTYTAVNVAGTVTRTTLNPVEIWISKTGYLTVYRKFTVDNDSRKVQVTLLHSPTPGRASMGSAIR